MPLARAVALFKRSSLVATTVRNSSYYSVNWHHHKKENKTKNAYFNQLCLNLSNNQNLSVKNTGSKAHSFCMSRFYSTNGDLRPEFNFEKECEETLESLLEHFEEILEGDLIHPRFHAVSETDVTLASGVLNVYLGNKEGTYVINKQAPNQQIWLSSPVSGPARFDYCAKRKAWIYAHSGESLHELLNQEIQKKILKDGVVAGFEKCYLGGDNEQCM